MRWCIRKGRQPAECPGLPVPMDPESVPVCGIRASHYPHPIGQPIRYRAKERS